MTAPDEDISTSASLKAAVAGLLLLLLIGGVLINVYIERERQRDLQQWEARLGLLADAKVQSVEQWIDAQFVDLEELAGNASLQLYLWQLTLARQQEREDAASAELAYLRNLILATAYRAGYVSGDAPKIPANLTLAQTTGLALLDADLDPVVGTPDMVNISQAFEATAQRAFTAVELQTSDLQLDDQDQAVVAFAVPVKAVLGKLTADPQRPLGVLLGVRSADADLFPLLKRETSLTENNEALLLRKSGNRVIYLSPAADGAKATRRAMNTIGSELAAAAAVLEPGGFVQTMNYEGKPVLQVSRAVRGSPWVVAQQVDAKQALRESNERRRYLISTLSLLLIAIAALAAAAWRHGSSVRARQHADELEKKTRILDKQSELLHAITDNIDILTIMVDDADEVLFQNRAMADAVGAEVREFSGQSLNATVGPALAKMLKQGIGEARAGNTTFSQIMQLQFGELNGIFQVSFIPVDRVGEHSNLVLMDFHDITPMQRAQRRQTSSMRTLVATLVQLLDKHDPYSAFHSARVAEVANAVAKAMNLSAQECKTLDLAAALSNIGKVMLPKDLLLKTGSLTDEERQLLAGHVDKGAELLQNLNLDPAVLQTMRQKQELLDGSGYPRGIKAAQMTMMGRILSVANAFVAMVSPRAYREAIAIRDAVDQLMSADQQFDRSVTTTLARVSQERPDWDNWDKV